MIAKMLDAVFGCRHSRYSFPVTIRGVARRPQAAALTGTYVACLDCGKELAYDWEKMRQIRSSPLTRPMEVFRRAAFGHRLRSAS